MDGRRNWIYPLLEYSMSADGEEKRLHVEIKQNNRLERSAIKVRSFEIEKYCRKNSKNISCKIVFDAK